MHLYLQPDELESATGVKPPKDYLARKDALEEENVSRSYSITQRSIQKKEERTIALYTGFYGISD